jgi:glutamyl-tRNA synthetase
LEFQESILADLKTLGIVPDVVSFTSDYFDEIEKKCLELIEAGGAYCDDTTVETVCFRSLLV